MATRIRTRCLVEHRPWRATRKNWRWDSVPIARAEHVASNGKTTYAWIRSVSHRTNGEMRSDRRVDSVPVAMRVSALRQTGRPLEPPPTERQRRKVAERVAA